MTIVIRAVSAFSAAALMLVIVGTAMAQTGTWMARSPLLPGKFHHGVAVANGLVYAVGGSDGTNDYTTSAHAYDPSSDMWMPLA